jgi:hypothetical protein
MPAARPIPRRALLRGGAGAAIALPLLDAMGRPRGAKAQQGLKRFIVYAHPLGTLGEWFWPVPPGGKTYAYPTPRGHTPRTGLTSLDLPLTGLSPILDPLTAHKADMLLVENLDNTTGNHPGYGAMLTGHPIAGELGGGISIDQEVANQIGKNNKFPSLQVGIKASKEVGKLATVSWYGAGKGAAPENSPQAIWERVFSDVQTNPQQASALLTQRKSVLDAALGQAGSLRAQVGAEDQKKIDNYLESFRAVEKRLSLGSISGAGCSKPPAPGTGTTGAPRGSASVWDAVENLPMTTRTQMDLLALALACDLTRVATIQMSNEANNLIFTFLGNTGRWHDLSHNGSKEAGWEALMDQYIKVQRWNSEMLGYLVTRMKELNVFTGSVVLWVNPMNNGQIHNSLNLPIALLGSAAGFFKQGRHVRLATNGDRGGGHYLNDLYISILQSMGVPATTFGSPAHVKGALAEIKA